MKMDQTAFRPVVRVAIATALLLMVPLVAMLVGDQVRWGPLDFAVAGTLLAGTGLLYEFGARNARNLAYRAGIALALLAALMLVWADLAVGIIGEPYDAPNLMYVAVLAVGAIGAVRSRLRAEGMARTLFATALAQALAAVVALAFALGAPREILVGNGLFVVLFLASALLFQAAARKQPATGAASVH